MPLFEIKNRWDGSVIFSLECGSIRLCVESAVKANADLRYANLGYADLGYADLRSANLGSADLRSANLGYADLRSANLGYADLRYANLGSANLGYADLRSANLGYADLGYADLRSANLGYADLRSANLGYADLGYADLGYADLRSANLGKDQLTWFRDDIWAVLSSFPLEVEGLRLALIEGRVDGSTYEGDCCCLVGTLSNVRGCKYDKITGLTPNSYRPAEQWFFGISKGDTPETNRASRFALEWVDQWMSNMRAAFGAEIFGKVNNDRE